MNEEKTVPVSIMKKTWNPEYNSVMKKIKALTVCFILLLFFNCLSAQNPGKLWARAAGGCNSVMGQSLSADPSGNIFVTGVFGYPSITFGNTTFYNSDSGVDLFLAKYDSRGNLLWASTAGCINAPTFGAWSNSVSTDAAGNAYITGCFSKAINLGGLLLTSGDTTLNEVIFVAKFSPAGNLLWARTAGGKYTGSGTANGCSTDAVGNVYITGQFWGRICFEKDTLQSGISGGNLFIVKFNQGGDEEWARTVSGINPREEFAVGYSVAAAQTGDVFVTGSFAGSLNLGNITLQAGPVARNLFLAKYNSAGDFGWATSPYCSANSTGANDSFSVAADADGNAYITGNYQGPVIGFGNFFFNNPDTSVLHQGQVFIVKYSASGAVLWAHDAGNTGFDGGTCVTADQANNACLTGFFTANSVTFGEVTLSSSDGLSFLVKYDPSGNVLWATNIQPWSQSTCADSEGGVYMTGYSGLEEFVFGPDTIRNSSYTESLYIAKFGKNQLISCDARFTITADTIPRHYWITNHAYGNPPLTYVWNWGDGASDQTAYPSHTYNSAGIYTICLTIRDSSGCTTTYCDTTNLSKFPFTGIRVEVIAAEANGTDQLSFLNSFRIYPNPASHEACIECLQPALIEIYSLQGKLVKALKTNKYKTCMDLSSLPRALYLIKLQSTRGVATGKLILQ